MAAIAPAAETLATFPHGLAADLRVDAETLWLARVDAVDRERDLFERPDTLWTRRPGVTPEDWRARAPGGDVAIVATATPLGAHAPVESRSIRLARSDHLIEGPALAVVGDGCLVAWAERLLRHGFRPDFVGATDHSSAREPFVTGITGVWADARDRAAGDDRVLSRWPPRPSRRRRRPRPRRDARRLELRRPGRRDRRAPLLRSRHPAPGAGARLPPPRPRPRQPHLDQSMNVLD